MKGSYYVTNLVCYYLKNTHSYGLKLYLKYCYKYLQTRYEDIQYKNKKMKTVSSIFNALYTYIGKANASCTIWKLTLSIATCKNYLEELVYFSNSYGKRD